MVLPTYTGGTTCACWKSHTCYSCRNAEMKLTASVALEYNRKDIKLAKGLSLHASRYNVVKNMWVTC